jgi:hypothetical protein
MIQIDAHSILVVQTMELVYMHRSTIVAIPIRNVTTRTNAQLIIAMIQRRVAIIFQLKVVVCATNNATITILALLIRAVTTNAITLKSKSVVVFAKIVMTKMFAPTIDVIKTRTLVSMKRKKIVAKSMEIAKMLMAAPKIVVSIIYA